MALRCKDYGREKKKRKGMFTCSRLCTIGFLYTHIAFVSVFVANHIAFDDSR